jgi:hypothetical protein
MRSMKVGTQPSKFAAATAWCCRIDLYSDSTIPANTFDDKSKKRMHLTWPECSLLNSCVLPKNDDVLVLFQNQVYLDLMYFVVKLVLLDIHLRISHFFGLIRLVFQ